MGEVGRGRFTHFIDDEIEALHGYLTSLDWTRPHPWQSLVSE